MKKLLLIIVFTLGFSVAYAQENDFQEFVNQSNKEFSDFKDKKQKEYDEFRRKINDEYAEFMAKTWDKFNTSPALPAPKNPEPPQPTVKNPDEKISEDKLSFHEVIPVPKPHESPKPMVPIIEIDDTTPQQIKPRQENPYKPTLPPSFTFLFYDTPCNVTLNESMRFTLPSISEELIANTWKTLSAEKYDTLINDCLDLRRQMDLCDWGYIRMLETLTDKFLGENSNEAVLLQMFILTQSGYKVRIAKANNKLILLLPSKETLYNHLFVTIDNERYYILNSNAKQNISVFNHAFPKEQIISLQIDKIPLFAEKTTNFRTYTSKHYPDISINLSTNVNLMDFYNNYPICDWNYYSRASLSDDIKSRLYPFLKQQINNKTQAEAANMLLNFVQTGFQYKTDNEQFGYERPLFGDETFYYPYSDCEDRSILYSILVRELMDIDVIFLYYTGHLATAVQFTDNTIKGDYFTIDGKKYIVCDPTYIGASIGNSMPQYKNESAKIIRIQ